MVLAEILTIVHILAAVALISNLVFLGVWKSWADRHATSEARAFVLDRLHALDRSLTAWLGLVTFAAGYAIIRFLGLFGGSISAAPWAFASLILMTVAGLVWYFVMLPLEVKMADAADRARDGSPLDAGYGRWSGAWFGAHGLVLLTVMIIAGLMEFKPGG